MTLHSAQRLTLLLGALAGAPSAMADIVWTGAVNNDIFNEGNWDLTQSTVTVIDPNVTIDDNVVIRNAAAPVEIPQIGGGQFRFQIGEGYRMTLDNSQTIALGDDGIGGIPGAVSGIDIDVINGARLNTFFVVNQVRVEVDATSTAEFGGGGNPINLSFLNITVGSTLHFILEDPTEYQNEHLVKTTVNGVPAVVGVNLNVVSDGATGSIVTAIPQTVGTNYCTANANSTGAAAAMQAIGSNLAAQNDVRLECTGMPNNSFAFFLTSTSQGFIQNPGGSQGNLCLSGAIGRYVGPGQIKNSGAAGMVALQLDLTQHPTPSGLVTVMSGQTWNFTCWYRDIAPSGMPSSNFADGLAIGFN